MLSFRLNLQDRAFQKILHSILKPTKRVLSLQENTFHSYPLKGLGLANFSSRLIQKDELVAPLIGEIVLSKEIHPTNEVIYPIGKIPPMLFETAQTLSDHMVGLKPPLDSPLSYFPVKKEYNLHMQPYLETNSGLVQIGLFAKTDIKPFSLLSIDPKQAIISPEKILKHLPTLHMKTTIPLFNPDPDKIFTQNRCPILTKPCKKGEIERLSTLLTHTFPKYGHPPPLLKDQINFIREWDLLKGCPWGLCYGQLPFGAGLFLSAMAPPIPKGCVIGLYAGEVKIYWEDPILNKDALRHLFAFSLPGIRSITKDEASFLEEIGLLKGTQPEKKGEYRKKILLEINGLRQGNFTRFVNHSSRFANLKYEIYREDNEIYLCFITRKEIKPGEQLLLNYGIDYWKNRSFEPLPLSPDSFRLSF